MQKIVSVFQRNYDTDRLIRDEVVPGAEWVLAGEGVATIKWDGTCCMVRDGLLYRRYELKPGKKAPVNFEPAQLPDLVTGAIPGWVPVGNGPEDRWFRAAFDYARQGSVADENGNLEDGTYEAIGPHFGGGDHTPNPEGQSCDTLRKHGDAHLDIHRDFERLRQTIEVLDIEGIVFHHPDGRMAKVKARDYGIKRRHLEREQLARHTAHCREAMRS